MKRIICAALGLALACICAGALGEIGFAEVRRDDVNFRKKPKGELIGQMDSGASVFVFEEREIGGQLWCHVHTDWRKRDAEGWIRGDMLRFLSEEFTDVVQVSAGSHYVMGLRGDGSAAIMGNDWAGDPRVRRDSAPNVKLSAQGEVIAEQTSAALEQTFSHGPYTAADCISNHIVALREDGRVDAFSLSDHYSGKRVEAVKTDGWTDVIAVAAGEDHTLGLRRDGTVYYAGDDGEHAWQVANWTDVVQLDAGKGYSIALRKDGGVVMAGVYEHYFR